MDSQIKQIADKLLLGFCDPPAYARPLYLGAKHGGLWYFWDGEKAIAPAKDAITCRIKSIDIATKEFKGKQNPKLHVKIDAGSQYTLVSGLETVTAKSLLWGLAAADLRQVLIISMSAGKEENAVFANVFQGGAPVNREEISYNRITESQILDLVAQLQSVLTGKAPTPKPESPAPEPLTGQGRLIDSDQAAVDRLANQIRQMSAAHTNLVRQKIDQWREAIGATAHDVLIKRWEKRCRELGVAATDRAGLIELIPVEMKKAGWDKAQAQQYLISKYSKRSRDELSNGELQEFLAHLRSQAKVGAW